MEPAEGAMSGISYALWSARSTWVNAAPQYQNSPGTSAGDRAHTSYRRAPTERIASNGAQMVLGGVAHVTLWQHTPREARYMLKMLEGDATR